MYMQFLPLALLLSIATAQSTSACAAQPVLEACLASTEAIVEGCGSVDYNCLCSKWNDVLTCFNQCPNDSRQSSVLASKETYCNDASVYTSSISPAISSAVSSTASDATITTTSDGALNTESSSATTSDAGGVRVSSTGTGTATATSSSASTSVTKNAGMEVVVNAGGLVLGVAGLVGVFL